MGSYEAHRAGAQPYLEGATHNVRHVGPPVKYSAARSAGDVRHILDHLVTPCGSHGEDGRGPPDRLSC
jgi:hypothetical protein